MISVHSREIWAIQQSARNILLEYHDKRNCTVQAEFCVTSLALDVANMALSNGRSISTYIIDKEKSEATDATSSSDSIKTENNSNQLVVTLLQTFNADCLALGLRQQNVFCLTTNDVTIYSIGGVVLHKVIASTTEGKIIGMDLTSTYLSIFTMNGYIKCYDVSRHDPRILFPAKSAYDIFEDFGEVILVKCNSDGTHLSILIANRSFVPQPTLYCWDFERNNLMEFDLRKDGMEKSEQLESCMPVSLWWDSDEPRLLAMEIKSMKQQQQNNEKHRAKLNDNVGGSHQYVEAAVWVFFYSDSNKLSVLETKDLTPGEQLVNICIPCVVRKKHKT